MTTIDRLVVRGIEHDRAGALLDELDTLITDLGDALAEQNAARLVAADAETEMEMRAASVSLIIDGRNEGERKARLTLALGEDAGYQQLAQAARHARAGLHDADRTITIVKARMALVRAALAVLADAPTR